MTGSGPDLVEQFRAARRDPGLVVLEGIHALKHALRFGADVLECVTPRPVAVDALAAELAPDVRDTVMALARAIDGPLYGRLAPAPHPTGVIAIARRPGERTATTLASPDPEPVVLLERPTHHGNIGAAVRVAAAARAAGVLVTGEHDPWHPASVRGAAGLQFALPVARVDALPESDRPVVVLDPEGEPLHPGALPARAVLVFGSERTGVSDELTARADRRVAIPMRPGVSSLNLATAVAICLYADRA